MVVALKLDPLTAEDIRSKRLERTTSRRILDLVERFRAELAPMHPAMDHPMLNTFFMAFVQSGVDAQSLASTLLNLAGVESAYVKPYDEAANS